MASSSCKRKTQSRRNKSSASLPEDLVAEILSWLPVLSLLQFKSVCKSWYSLIQSSHFIDLHLRRHRHQCLFMAPGIGYWSDQLLYSLVSCRRNPELVFHRNTKLPNLSKVSSMTTLFCNGIICFCYFWDKNKPNENNIYHQDDEYYVDDAQHADDEYYYMDEAQHADDQYYYIDDAQQADDEYYYMDEAQQADDEYYYMDEAQQADDEYYIDDTEHPDDKYIVEITLGNPSTDQFRTLPHPLSPTPQPHTSTISRPSFGFGFDSRTNDYKLVLIFFIHHDTHTSSTHVQVYSLSTNSWRIIDCAFPIDCVNTIFRDVKATCKGGTYCCWWGINSSQIEFNPLLFGGAILTFDFCAEKFKAIPLPDDLNVKRDPSFVFGILNDNIVLINTAASSSHTTTTDTFYLKQLDIWVLKEYNIKDSWTKLYTIGPFTNSIPKVIFKDRFLLMAKRDEFFIYDIITGESKNIAAIEKCFHSEDHQFMMIAVCEESLVSIK